MPTLTFSYTDGDDNQIWLKGTGAAEQAWTFTVSGIPSGSTINSVTLGFVAGNTYASPGHTQLYWGSSALSANRLWYVSGTNAGNSVSVDLTSRVTGNGSYTVLFRKTANSSSSNSNVYFTSIVVTVVYTIPYTQCTAPTNVTVSPTTCAPGGTATLSWSGGKAGSNMSIAGYHIYRSTDGGATYSILSAVGVVSSLTVTGPETDGASYIYKVYTIGSVSGYNSGGSTVVATLTCDIGAPGAPTWAVVSKCISAGENVSLSWGAGSDGTNNAVSAYKITYSDSIDGSSWSPEAVLASVGVDVLTYSVAPPEAGYRRYFVVSVGTVSGSDSGAVIADKDICNIGDFEFTDSVLTSGETRVKAVHMTELQDIAKIVCACFKGATPNLSDIVAGQTSLAGWSDHVGEVREALDGVGVTHADWIEIAENKPSAAVIQQLREVLLAC